MSSPIPRIGVGVLIKHEGKLLLGKRKNSHGEGLWACPGGHLEFGETPEETARREALEEVNLTIENLRFVTKTNDFFPKENKHYITLFYEADLSAGELKLMEPLKCEEWKWFSWDKLPEPLFPTMTSLKEQGYFPVFTKRKLRDGFSMREARLEDLETIQALLEDDKLGKAREDGNEKSSYETAFKKILGTPHHYLLVFEKNNEIVGTLQLNFLENLTFMGSRRAQFEGARIKKEMRGQGLGRLFFESAILVAKEAQAQIIQLTMNKERGKALSFYHSLGFQASHEGFKLYL